MKQFVKKHWSTILLIAILAVGAYLRLHMIRNYMTFLGDEGRDVLIVKRIIVDHKFTLLGPTASVGGFFLGPIYYYFMVPFLWISHLDPVGPAIMVALFGVATICLVFKVGKDFFDARAGLIAASCYACSPLVIRYSRSSWNPNVVPFFSILLVYFLWRVVTGRHKVDAFWIGMILGIGIQLHYLFLFLFIVVAVWYIINRRSIGFWSSVGKTSAGFLVGVSPFLAFELRHGFANTRTVIQFVFAGKDTGFVFATFISTVQDVIFRLFGRLLFRVPERQVWQNYPAWYITTLLVCIKASVYASLLLCLGTLLYPVKKLRQKINHYVKVRNMHHVLSISKNSFIGLLLCMLWFAVVVLLFGLYKKAIYDYYFGIMFPLPFLLIGYALSKLCDVKNGTVVAAAVWIGLVVFNWQGRPFIYPPNNQLQQVQTIARVALDKTDGQPFNFALITDGNSDQGYRYFFEIWGYPPTVIENTQNDPARMTVTNQLIVICETLNCQPLGNSLWEVAGFGRAEIVGSWDVPFVKIYKLVHYKET
jgi:4-amino-4-deoxy-L-arabinose transferase-like glycosyltransferase